MIAMHHTSNNQQANYSVEPKVEPKGTGETVNSFYVVIQFLLLTMFSIGTRHVRLDFGFGC